MNISIKLYLTIPIVFLLVGFSFAQDFSANSVANTYSDSSSFAQRLVDAALANYEEISMSEKSAKVAKIDRAQARLSWMQQFYISGNLNEFTIEGSNERALFFPRYNIGVTLPLSIFTDVANKSAKATAEYELALQNIELTKRTIKAEVLRRYQQYLTSLELVKLQRQGLDDMQLNFNVVEEQYGQGDVEIEDYNDSLEKLNQQRVNKAMAENEFFLAKISLEEMVGKPLEEF